MDMMVTRSEGAPRPDGSDRVSRVSMPRILLVTTVRWFGTARLAAAFLEAGCDVECVCPPNHPIETLREPPRRHAYSALRPMSSIGRAILAARPALIVPCDDLATLTLHRLHAEGFGGIHAGLVRSAIERSLGAPEHYQTIASRARVLEMARGLGVAVPPTCVVNSEDDLHGWLRSHGTPAVLKADGTSGGRGVRVIVNPADCRAAWRHATAPPSPARAVKRTLVNRDRNFLRPCLVRTRAVANVQRFVDGVEANTLVACWKGRVLACIAVIVLERSEAFGPASVVQIVEHAGMSGASERIVQRLGLSGLVGFDFILDRATGDSWLIEVNPRTTQLGHFRLGPGGCPVDALVACLETGRRPEGSRNITSDIVALFPQEWLRDPRSAYLQTSHHDVPWAEPGLTRACVDEDARIRWWTRAASFCETTWRRWRPLAPPPLHLVPMARERTVRSNVDEPALRRKAEVPVDLSTTSEPALQPPPCPLPRRTA